MHLSTLFAALSFLALGCAAPSGGPADAGTAATTCHLDSECAPVAGKAQGCRCTLSGEPASCQALWVEGTTRFNGVGSAIKAEGEPGLWCNASTRPPGLRARPAVRLVQRRLLQLLPDQPRQLRRRAAGAGGVVFQLRHLRGRPGPGRGVRRRPRLRGDRPVPQQPVRAAADQRPPGLFLRTGQRPCPSVSRQKSRKAWACSPASSEARSTSSRWCVAVQRAGWVAPARCSEPAR